MTDFAFFRLPDGRAWLGLGPFTESEGVPEGTAFYTNDFDLTDPRPWKKPARLVEVAGPESLKEAFAGGSPELRIVWEKPRPEAFKMVFRRIRREVVSGRLIKMVPVVTQSGTVEGDPATLLQAVMAAPDNLWGYARAANGRGFIGATPELLFQAEGHEVSTMALAGTAKPGHEAAFLTDVKEIQEHEIVAEFLAERLAPLGQVEREARHPCEAAGLRHFQTRLRVHCPTLADPNQLVRLLHPTPAVGCLPRTDEWLAKLREYRALLDVPGFFGAPFGFSHAGAQHFVVSIRALGWEGGRLALPSGCGIVGGSAFDHEWRELRLKREAVVRLLGV